MIRFLAGICVLFADFVAIGLMLMGLHFHTEIYLEIIVLGIAALIGVLLTVFGYRARVNFKNEKSGKSPSRKTL